MSKKIAGTVILYNPDEKVLENINSYVSYIDKLYVIDNSESPNSTLKNRLKEWGKTEYISNKENFGVAKALNIAATKAITDKYEWLLTMDQDGYFQADTVKAYFNRFNEFNNYNDVAIFSPCFRNITDVENNTMRRTIRADQTHEYRESTAVMTSGNLLNLSLFIIIGTFEEKLFIDEVDHDYCLRANMMNYKIVEFPDVILDHQPGRITEICVRGKIIKVYTHSPQRIYYITRNNFYIWNKYYRSFPAYIRFRIRCYCETVKLTLLHEKSLIILCYALKGALDFMMGKYGKICSKQL